MHNSEVTANELRASRETTSAIFVLSVITIATKLRTGRPGSNSRQGQW